MACARRCSSWPLGRLMPRGDGRLGRLPPFGRVDFLRISCRCEDLPSRLEVAIFFEVEMLGAFGQPTERTAKRSDPKNHDSRTATPPSIFRSPIAPHLRDSLMVLNSRACSRSTPRPRLSGAVTYMKPGRRQPMRLLIQFLSKVGQELPDVLPPHRLIPLERINIFCSW